MLNSYFGYAITLKSIIAFMELFDNIKIYSFDSNDNQNKEFTVPITFASPEKFLALKYNTALNMDQNKDQNPSNIEAQLILPRMSVALTDVLYDSTRKLQKIEKIFSHEEETDTTKTFVFTGVPYIINFELFVATKKVFDLFQILEQIFPFFTPTLSVDIVYIPNLGSESVPIKLDNVTLDIPQDMSTEEDRLITAELTFTMKVNYYLPEFTRGKITKIDVDYGDLKNTYEKFLTYVITPVNPISQYPQEESYKEQTIEKEEF